MRTKDVSTQQRALRLAACLAVLGLGIGGCARTEVSSIPAGPGATIGIDSRVVSVPASQCPPGEARVVELGASSGPAPGASPVLKDSCQPSPLAAP